jgi:hypothetical protein
MILKLGDTLFALSERFKQDDPNRVPERFEEFCPKSIGGLIHKRPSVDASPWLFR